MKRININNKKKFKKIYLEIGNICNLQCSFCPEIDRTKFQIELNTFEDVLLQLKPLTERVCFHLMGEPTLHPKFNNLIEIAQKVNVPVEITTNATLLNEKITSALLNPTVEQVNFSLQSFFDNFPNADPIVYLRKIFNFTKQAFDLHPNLYLNYRLWNLGNESQNTNEFVISEIEKEFEVSLNRNVDPGFRKSKRIKNHLYLHFDQRFEWPSLKSPIKSEVGTCYGTRDHIGIHANGSVVPCCLDKEAVLDLGNIHETSLQNILESHRFKKIKQGFEAGVLKEDLCQRCDYVQRFSKKKGKI